MGNWDSDSGCYRRLVDGDLEPGCSPFQSIVHTMYWGIQTVTTVGYGDVVPISALGKFIAGVSMVSGIISLALPIGMMSTAFSEAMEHIKEEEEKGQRSFVDSMDLLKDLEGDGNSVKNSPRESDSPLIKK